MAAEGKAQLIENIQNALGKGKWKDAVADMEKLFALNPDPIIRVRMGDAYQKLNSKPEAQYSGTVPASRLFNKTTRP